MTKWHALIALRPIRELSILVGAVMGTRLLAEGDAPRRLVAALVMVLGILTLAVN